MTTAKGKGEVSSKLTEEDFVDMTADLSVDELTNLGRLMVRRGLWESLKKVVLGRFSRPWKGCQDKGKYWISLNR